MDNTFTKTDGNFARKLPTNLSEYYQSQGRTLPTVAERATAYGDSNYNGTKEQNNTQLQRLLNPAPTGTSPAPTAPTMPTAQQEQPVTNNPYDAFGMLLQEELKKAQTINTTDLLKQQRELQRQRIAQIQGTAGTQLTDEERRALSPEQQSSIRSSGIAPTETAIDAVQNEINQKNQTRKDLLEQIMLAKDQKDKSRENALNAEYKKADLDFKKTQAEAEMAFKEKQLAETMRSNKASEYLSGKKASGSADNLLSVAEAAAAGVPYGTTKQQLINRPVTAVDTSKSLDQINLVKRSIKNATDLAGAAGGAGIRDRAARFLMGSADIDNLTAETNTLRTNILTMAADPSIKKFFGPQMSNADVQLMTSAGTTLNPELQSPAQIKEELLRLTDFVARAEKAVKTGQKQTVNTPATTGQVMAGGVLYNVDANGDMTPAE